MRIDLKVQQKGLLLVSIPLVFELIFVATLVFLQQQAESAAARLYHSKEIIRRAEVVNRRIYDAGASFSVWGITRSPAFEKRFMKSIDEVPKEVAALKELVKNNPVQRANVAAFARETEGARVSLLDYKTKMEAGHSELTSFSRIEIAKLLHELVSAGSKVLNEELSYQKQHPEDEQNARNLVRLCLLIGVVANILITVFMAVFFSRDITQRLATIVDNTKLLTTRQPLKQPLDGDDEIAQLDRVFHLMAVELDTAARKESAIIDNAQDVICSLDERHFVTKMSPAAERMWGYFPPDLVGSEITDLVAEEDREQFLRVLSDAREGKDAALSLDVRMIRKDGTSGYMLWSIYWSPSEGSYFCVAHDISDRKMLDQMKQDFVNMISHDLRTPLTGMRAFLDTLSAGAYGTLSEKGDKAANRIQSSLARLVNLVNDLLDIEKMEAGKMEMRFEPVMVSSIVNGGIDMVKSFAEQQRVLIEIVNDGDLEVVADGDRLVQVLQNLLGNAVKFSPSDSTVTVSWNANGEGLEVRVTDRGKGISQADCEAIFDRFRQASPDAASRAADPHRGGTGLGLAICKAIVEQHNGSIGVESQEGKGSTFWFRLPIQEKASAVSVVSFEKGFS